MNEALDSEVPEPAAMTLSTIDPAGRPSARVVLLKEFSETGFVFFTDFESNKARDLALNLNAHLHLFWPELNRQISIRGTADKMATEASGSNFKDQPAESRIDDYALKQSGLLASNRMLEKWLAGLKSKFEDRNIPLPGSWGGYCVAPTAFEFWQGHRSRLHDRICYEPAADGLWKVSRISR
jgi:pyridoxamine 5'-phosphate oxidase